MNDKHELITGLLQCMRRLIDKHARLDDSPLHFAEGVVISPREIRTVEFIGIGDSTNVSDVAAHFHFTKSAASQLVTRLVKRGFVSKRTSAQSGKEVSLTLTSQGREAHRKYEAMVQELAAETMSRLETFSLHQISTASVLVEVMEGIVDERLKKFG